MIGRLVHRTTFWVVCGSLLWLTACGSKRPDPGYLALVEQEGRIPEVGELGVGDKFSLEVHNETELSGEFTVSSLGTISYPYLGRIEVAGKTCTQVEDLVTAGLADGYLVDPSVRCSITEYVSKQIYIFGEVRQPGAFPYKANITIVEAMALAGGFTERASTNDTKLSRVVRDREVQVRVPVQDIVEGRSRNIKILPGDIIYVPTLPY